MNRRSGFASIEILVVGVIVVLVAAAFYFLGQNSGGNSLTQPSPTPDGMMEDKMTEEMSDWEIYNGEHFTVKYPNSWHNWSFGRGVSLDYFQINTIKQELHNASQHFSHISFDIQTLDYTDNKTLEEQNDYLENLAEEYPELAPYQASEQVFNGVKALVYERKIDNTSPGNSPSYDKTIWFIKDEVKYIITWNVREETIEKRDQAVSQNQPEVDQILSTFEFTDSSGSMSDLETYTNTKYHYSLKYPSGWEINDESYGNPVSADSERVLIYNPDDDPENSFYSGMTIQYHGGIINTTGYERVYLDHLDATTYMQNTNHGEIYYINIPDTDQFFSVDGADGHTNNEETNTGLREIFESISIVL